MTFHPHLNGPEDYTDFVLIAVSTVAAGASTALASISMIEFRTFVISAAGFLTPLVIQLMRTTRDKKRAALTEARDQAIRDLASTKAERDLYRAHLASEQDASKRLVDVISRLMGGRLTPEAVDHLRRNGFSQPVDAVEDAADVPGKTSENHLNTEGEDANAPQ